MTAESPEVQPDFSDWVGRSEIRADLPAVTAARAMAATLDCPELALDPGDPLPPGWHWMLFNAALPPGELGEDGHPRRGGFLPPVPLPRRMWAGGRLVFHRPLSIGVPATRQSTIA